MTIEITVGPPVLTINKGDTFMVTNQGGEIESLQAQGVFHRDTRFVSGYHFWLDRAKWDRLSSAVVTYDSARVYLINKPVRAAGLSSETFAGDVGLSLLRSVQNGIHELFTITNFSGKDIAVVFELEIESDFADLFEVKSGDLKQRENMISRWSAEDRELTTDYRNGVFQRRFSYKVVSVDAPPTFANGRLMFPVHLKSGESWNMCGQMLLESGSTHQQVTSCPPSQDLEKRIHELHQRWVDTCTSVKTSSADIDDTYQQSVSDLGALRLHERDLSPDVWIPAAGVPWFVTLFGRDSLITSYQGMFASPVFAQGTLRTLAEFQAQKRDDFRDAQPGKIMHEVRYGELAQFNKVPQTPYYGTWDATPLYLMVLAEAYRWSGDRQLIQDLLPAAEQCLEWIDKYGDLDGDGFQEYKTFSPEGYENMSWKDAGNSVVYPDGSQVKQPKALCELQGYVYAGKIGMAEIYRALGQDDNAARMETEAADLKTRFNGAFWMEDEGFYAFGLDPDKRQIKSISSNPGHCLWTGIVDDDKAEKVVRRLLEPDMWTGWGIRTLSSDNPAYNPHSYQRGSVWPHDNGIIAAGMKRYGFADEANQVASGIFDAANRFLSRRLPEVFSGLSREAESFPVQYRGANTPQAWAAGSIFQFFTTMLGLEPDAAGGKVWVNPTLPDWLPEVGLRGLKVGVTSLDILFRREDGKTSFEVKSMSGGQLDVSHAASHSQ